ncbi:uncharacterized protein [Acropora muricata]|uniref:uncharacterized protein isoform X4 n=1 Tax=Acropora muricata TaxID=159855 RepID=UPI0034E3CCFF
MREAADFAGEMREPFSCTTKVTLESGKVVRYEYLKEHSEISSRNEDINDEACSKDEDSAFPELHDVASHKETNTKDDESYFPDPHDFEKAWGEDKIEDVLEK